MAKHPRGTRFIDWRVQGELIGRTICHWACFLVASFAVIFLLDVARHLLAQDDGALSANILQDMWGRYSLVVIAMASLVPLFILDLILWSHRFVGPLVRIRRGMRELVAGQSVPAVRLRKKDYWQDLADDFNLLRQRVEDAEQRAKGWQSVALEHRAPVSGAELDTPSLAASKSPT